MLKDKTKIVSVGQSKYFLIPYEVFNDSAFPFKENDELNIEIKNKQVGISE